MSTPAHTPGPWTLLLPQPAEDEDGHPTGAFSYPGGIEGADGNPVCEFSTLAGSGTMFENEADHLLIAAAPDLLAAARKVLDGLNLRLDHAAQTGAPSPIFFGIGDLHAAIAKAEGAVIADDRAGK